MSIYFFQMMLGSSYLRRVCLQKPRRTAWLTCIIFQRIFWNVFAPAPLQLPQQDWAQVSMKKKHTVCLIYVIEYRPYRRRYWSPIHNHRYCFGINILQTCGVCRKRVSSEVSLCLRFLVLLIRQNLKEWPVVLQLIFSLNLWLNPISLDSTQHESHKSSSPFVCVSFASNACGQNGFSQSIYPAPFLYRAVCT